MRTGHLRNALMVFVIYLKACALAVVVLAVRDTFHDTKHSFGFFVYLMALCVAATVLHWFAKDIEGIIK